MEGLGALNERRRSGAEHANEDPNLARQKQQMKRGHARETEQMIKEVEQQAAT